MALPPPLTKLPIETRKDGFYQGFNFSVALGSKILIALLIIWAAVFPDQAGAVLKALDSWVRANFNYWYMYVVFFYIVVCLALALWPTSGRVILGRPGEEPEFSRFSWFSMMFGAGIGIGMLTFATAEPIYHFSTNPDVIQGLATGQSEDNIRAAYRWSFLHWGFSAWACYAIVGLALAFFSYSRGLPLTIRSGLTPLFGKSLSGPLGHTVDIVSVIATILGVSVTIGFGVAQFASGIYYLTGAGWIVNADGSPTVIAMLLALLIVMGASTLSAMSGVGRGIKWLSNINMGLSLFLLAFFIVFGATIFVFKALIVGTFDYVVDLIPMSLTVWNDDGTDVGASLAGWQGGWTLLYWPWWIAFAPFVGLFLARISRGRSLREFVLGAMIVPAIMCFVWFAFVGGTAIDLELQGVARGAILGADQSAQLFETINVMLGPLLTALMTFVIVILLLTFLVTSADSAVLIINTIAAGGDASQKGTGHIVLWGSALTLVIGVLLIAGSIASGNSAQGLVAIQTAMIIGALPFSVIMALMGISLFKAMWRDSIRAKSGAS